MNIDDLHLMRKFSDVGCTCLRFADYEHRVINGNKCIIGLGNAQFTSTETKGLFKDRILLDTQKLSVKLKHPNLRADLFNERCTDSDLDLMVEWCKKHGMPMLENLTEDRFKTQNRKTTQQRISGCTAGSFYERLWRFRDLFYLWVRVYRTDLMTDDNPYKLLQMDSSKRYLSLRLQCAEMYMTLRYENNRMPSFTLAARQLIDIPFIQMALMITSPPAGKLRLCKGCNEPFYANGRALYCEYCDRQSNYRTSRKIDPGKSQYDRERGRLYQQYYRKKITDAEYKEMRDKLRSKFSI